MKTLVVYCHPNPESFSAALYARTVNTLNAGGHELRCFDLYAENFQPVLTLEERVAYLPNPGLIEGRVKTC